MTNKIALGLGLMVLGFFAIDYVVFDAANTVFLARKFIDFVDYIAFWR
ncbi:hypothetical protein [Pseudaestuariivita rosea]|nr:hypothetical protein [Pseudaestuariivita rosea]